MWKNCRLLVVDEISFAGYNEVLRVLSKNMQEITDNHDIPFGGMHILFIGDFMQLNPTQGSPIYMDDASLYWKESLNLMVELTGNWRFKDCPFLTAAFPVFRKYGMTPALAKLFNSRVIGSVNDGVPVTLPDIRDTKITTFHNKLRSEANDCIFLEHLKKHHSKNPDEPIPEFTVIVKSRPTWAHNDKPLSNKARNKFYHEVKEDNPKDGANKTIDPLLKLFYLCEMMHKENASVNDGVANGTTALFEYLSLIKGAQRHKVCYNGFWVWAVNAEDVNYMRLKWTRDSTFKGHFCIQPKTKTYTVEVTRKELGRVEKFKPKIKIMQFPVTVNHATTGHKLQGKSVDSLVVWEWSTQPNWIYVVLSRVKTLAGLYLRKPIPTDAVTGPNPVYTEMMSTLRAKLYPRANSEKIARYRAHYNNSIPPLVNP